MNSFSTDRWDHLARQAGVALCYLLLYKVSLIYATAHSQITLIWLPGGMALAALLLGGQRFWPSIFAGAFGVSLLSGNGWLASVAIAAGSSAEPLLGAWLLRRAGFNPALRRTRDFFKLMFLAGLLSPAVSALTGVGTLVLNDFIDASVFLPNLLYWWMGDMLSIILITPLILVWRQPLHGSMRSWRTLELALLLALAFLFGQIVFLDWLHESIGPYARRFLVFLFVAWAAVRFGRHGALLILSMVLTQALFSMLFGVGYFGASMTPSGLANFWLYFSELVVLGLLLATTIGERRASELSLRDSEQRWNLALAGIGDGVWEWNPQTGAVFVSRQWQEMLGYAENEIKVSLEEWSKLVHPDDLSRLRADLHAYLRGETASYINEHRLLCRDGSWKWVLDRGAVVSRSADGQPLRVIGTHTDLTERRRIDNALRDSEQHFRAFFERSMIGMASCSIDKDWLEVNDAVCEILGYSRQALLRTSWVELTHPDDRQADIAPFERVVAGQIDDYELDKRYVHKDGSIVHAHVAVRGLRKPDHSFDYFVLLIQDVTEKKRTEELIWKQANFDALTGLVNRRMLRDRLEQDLKLAQRGNHAVALLFIDLDRFKEVNDTLGHAAGDTLLIEAARRISDCVRQSDTVARLGGDEFMVILAQLHDTDHVEVVAKNILTRLLEPFQLEQGSSYVSASIGITVFPNDAGDADSLLKNADQAMYVAKSQGRNRFSYFTNALQLAAQHRLRLITDLRDALAGDRLCVHFQPIVELATGHIFKAEALLRWRHPQRGMIGPAEFIPLAEETGLINPIGSWVFREAARWAKRWAGLGLNGRGVQVSVNKSPMQFRAEADSRALLGYLSELQLPRNSIVIEITEGLLLNAETGVIDRLRKFRDAGIQVAIDDFGTGYSSLSYLKKFDIDYLKIDQSFVRNLAPDSHDMALSEAIIVMAHKLGLKVIAEGVETEQQRALLSAAGCDYAQGYLFSPPLPPAQFEALLGLEQVVEKLPATQ